MAGERAPERGLLSCEGGHVAMQGGRKSSDGQGAAVGGVALAAAQAIAAGKKVTCSIFWNVIHSNLHCVALCNGPNSLSKSELCHALSHFLVFA